MPPWLLQRAPICRALIHSLDPNLTIHPPLFYLSTWHDEVNAFVRTKIREHRDDMVAASFNTYAADQPMEQCRAKQTLTVSATIG